MRILVPTRNSGQWIATIAAGYRSLGIRPFYLVDQRSEDDTLKILHDAGEEHASFLPSASFAEAGMIEAGANLISDDWILRLDDDEFPCNKIKSIRTDRLDPSLVYGIARDECIVLGKQKLIKTARWPSVFMEEGAVGRSIQYRLFNKNFAQYNNKVHTPGYETTRAGLLSPEIFIAHFNCVVRNAQQRLEKVRRYAHHDRRGSYAVADEYLPELQSESDFLEIMGITDTAIADVARRLPVCVGDRPILTPAEIKLRSSIAYRMGKGSNPARLFPINVQIKAAEFLGTMANVTRSDFLRSHAEAIWNHTRRQPSSIKE